MVSLDTLLSSYSGVLVIDAASSRIQVGWYGEVSRPAWRSSAEDSGEAIFHCLEGLQVNVREIGAVVFCEGPGSLLGVRTVATLIRTWQLLNRMPIFSFRSLELVALAGGECDIGMIADARRETWHLVEVDAEGHCSAVRRVSSENLPRRLRMPDHFRTWAPLPEGVVRVPYDLACMLEAARAIPLLRPVDEPDAFAHEANHYVTWTPQVHRAPP